MAALRTTRRGSRSLHWRPMPSGLMTRGLARAATRMPGLRRLPVFKLLAAAEIALLARNHIAKLSPEERRRALELIRLGRGRPSNLTAPEREELATLVEKAELRRFGGLAVDKLSPVPLPRRIIEGRKRR